MAVSTATPRDPSAREAKRSAELCVLMDGVGWRFADQLNFLEWLPHRRPLRTVLGYSSTAVPSLLSGLTPAEHGAWTLYFRSPGSSPFAWTRPFRLVPFERIPKLRWRFREWLHRQTVLRSEIKGYFALYDVPLRYRYLFDVAWKAGLFEPGGSLPTFINEWGNGADVFVGAYPSTDDSIREGAERAVAAGASRILCYFGDLDQLLHQHAGESDHPRLRSAFSAADDWIRTQVEALRRLHGSVKVTCFSDHGMTPVHTKIDLRPTLSGLRLGRDYLCFLDSTLARFWAEDRVLLEIAHCLEGMPGQFLTRDEFAAERLPYDPRRFGDLVWLADPGVCITPSWMGATAPAGMHGYSPADAWSDGMLMTNNDQHASAWDVVELGKALVRTAVAGRVAEA